MTVDEIHYFRIECNDCNVIHPYEDDNAVDVIDAATEDGWLVNQDTRGNATAVLCPKCTGLNPIEDPNAQGRHGHKTTTRAFVFEEDTMIIYLDIMDMAIGGGFHLYGTLVHYKEGVNFPDDPFTKVKLDYAIDTHQAAKFNRNEPGAYKAYHPGDKSQRFESYEHLYRVARAEWKTHFPQGLILLKGSNGAMPRRVLGGLTQAQRDHLESIYQEGEALDWLDYRRNFAATESVMDRWFQALSDYGVPTRYAQIPQAQERRMVRA